MERAEFVGHDQRAHLSPLPAYLLLLFSAMCRDAGKGGKNVECWRFVEALGNTACTLSQNTGLYPLLGNGAYF